MVSARCAVLALVPGNVVALALLARLSTLERNHGTRVVYKHVFHTGELEVWRDAALNAERVSDGLREVYDQVGDEADDEDVRAADLDRLGVPVEPHVQVADTADAALADAAEAEAEVSARKQHREADADAETSDSQAEFADAVQRSFRGGISGDNDDDDDNDIPLQSDEVLELDSSSEFALDSELELIDDDTEAADGSEAVGLPDDSIDEDVAAAADNDDDDAVLDLGLDGVDIDTDTNSAPLGLAESDAAVDDLEEEGDADADVEGDIDLGDGSDQLRVQVKPISKHTFSYYRSSSCGYLCDTLRKDKWKFSQSAKSPTMYLIRWKSYEKYKNVKRSIVNQIGKTGSCIGGMAYMQVRCREEFARSFGCSLNDLSIGPDTINLGDSASCRAFIEDAAAEDRNWVVKASSGWLGTNGVTDGAPVYRGAVDLAKLTRSCKSTKRAPVVQEFVVAPRKARAFFVVASLRPLVVLFHPGVTWDEGQVDISSTAEMQTAVAKTGRKELAKIDFRAVDEDDRLAQRMREVVGFIMGAAQSQGLDTRRGRFQVFSADFAVPGAASESAQLLDVTGEPLQVAYPGANLSPQIWTSLYQTVEQLHTAPPQTLDRLRLSAGWELLRLPEWSASRANPCQKFAAGEAAADP